MSEIITPSISQGDKESSILEGTTQPSVINPSLHFKGQPLFFSGKTVNPLHIARFSMWI